MRVLLVLFLFATLAIASAPPPKATTLDRFLARYDKNKDGLINRAEWPGQARAFRRLDADKNGTLDRKELASIEDRLGRFLTRDKGGRPGEVTTPAARGERKPDQLKVGDVAPDFTLPVVGNGKKTINLASFKGKKPVVLIFASYT